MTSLLSSLWGTAKSSSSESGGRKSLEERRASLENAEKAEEMRRVVEADTKFQPAVRTHTGTNVWQSVFNPGRNMSMKQTTREYFDHPAGSDKATTWDHVLKSEQVKKLTFNQLDKNGDGFITADELKAELSGSSIDMNNMIKQADKNGDGKVDYAEFCEMFRNSPSA